MAGRSPDPRGGSLLAPKAPVALTQAERDFLEAGLTEAQRRARAQRRQLYLARAAAVLFFIIAAGAGALGVAAWQQSARATAASARATGASRMASARLARADEQFLAARVLFAAVRPIPDRGRWFNSALDWNRRPTPVF